MHAIGIFFLSTSTSKLMSHPEVAIPKDEPAEDECSNASSPVPRSFASLEYEVRSDIRCLVKDKVAKAFDDTKDEEDEDEEWDRKEYNESRIPSDELKTLAREFVECVAQEKRCTSHTMRRTFSGSLAPGVVLDTAGASLFFFRFWEAVVDEGTKSRDHWWSSSEKTLVTASDWDTLEQTRTAADQRTDRAIGLVKLAQGIECEVAAGWNVWMRPAKWSDLPLLENIVKDHQFAPIDAISHHERFSEPRIQRYICGASLPLPKHIKKGDVRDLVGMRWKWLQLQRFSALLWNDVGRTEYFSHAMCALDALVNFAPQESSVPPMSKPVPPVCDESAAAAVDGDEIADSMAEKVPEAREETADLTPELGEDHQIPPVSPLFYYANPEPFEEWTPPPLALPPTVIQLLLAEGAAIWLHEAMPVIRRYIEHKPRTDLERMWFECTQESDAERREKWNKWREGLEKVHRWCTAEGSGMPSEATVIKAVVRALQTMVQAEYGVEREMGYVSESAPRLAGQVCLSCCA